ncbi:MAG: TraX family protein [Lachnospiraceae bacterium]
MSAFQLKIIAIIAMTLNHVAHVFGEDMPDLVYYVCMGIGGMTFPIMAYFMAEGWKYTRNVRKYALRLLLFALLAFFPYVWTMGTQLNVLFTLLLGLLIIYLYETMKSRRWFWFVFILVVAASSLCDWAFMGVPMILCSHVIKNKRGRVILPVAIAWGVMGLFLILSLIFGGGSQRSLIAQAIYAFVGCTLTIPALLSYNGERGPAMKYLFYAYYPAHLTVLAILKLI